MAFDTTRLVAQITLKGALPGGAYTDQELLDLAYDSLVSEITPLVMAARQDYYIVSQDLPVGTSSVFPIPYRAQNGVLREVKLIRGTQIIDLDRIKLDDVTSTALGLPNSFYVEGNDVVLYPAPASNTGDILRLFYWVRPSKLVPVASTATITAIVGTTVSVTIPFSWSTANTFDLVRGKAHFDILSMDLVASSVAGGAITFSSLPASLAVGDVVCLSEETCFPFLPPEGHVALVQSTVTTALESLNDPAAATSAQKAQALKATFTDALKTRVEGATTLGKRLL